MIFEILAPVCEYDVNKIVILRPYQSYAYDMFDLCILFESCGWKNAYVCNASGYENAVALFKQ
jgi:hypothetical protein